MTPRRKNDGCPLYCKYCGARLRLDSVGHYCPTRKCKWRYGVQDCPVEEKPMDPAARQEETR
jgi:hypothetical protein